MPFLLGGVTMSSMPIEMPDLRRVKEAHRLQIVEQQHRLLVAELADGRKLTSDCRPFFFSVPLTYGRPSRVRRSLKITRPAVVSMTRSTFSRTVARITSCLLCSSVRSIRSPCQRSLILRLRFDDAGVESEQHFVDRSERLVLALHLVAGERQVVAAEHDVLRRNRDRLAAGRRKKVVRRKHQNARFDLRFGRKRNVNGHLVAVEVGVERRTDERMDLDRLTFDQHRLETPECRDGEASEHGSKEPDARE